MQLRSSVLMLFSVHVAACRVPATELAKEPPAPRELVLVATTDFHGALDRAEGLASVLRDLRRRHGDRMVYADGGDQFQGTLEGRFGKGEAVVAFFNLLGLDVAAVGNHELTFGPSAEGRVLPRPGEDPIGNLRARAAQAHYAWISANWVTARSSATSAHVNAVGQPTVVPPHAIVDRGGARTCFIGATTPQTPGRTLPDFVRGTSFEPLAPIVAVEAAWLRTQARCTFVVLVTHAGLVCKPSSAPVDCLERGPDAEVLELLEHLPERTLDAVVAGHTHLAAQAMVRGTPVIEAGANGKLVGVVHVFEGAARPAVIEPFIEVPERADAPDATRLLAPFRAKVEALRARPAGEALGPLLREVERESALGNLVADALLQAGRAEGATVAVMHAGHLRDGLPGGALRYEHVYRALPFDNSLVIAELSGLELRRMVETAMSGAHGVASVSGLTVTLARASGAPAALRYRLADVRDERGEALRADRIYKVATIDYLARGGDEQEPLFLTVPPSRLHFHEDVLTRDLLADHLRNVSPVAPERLLASPRVLIQPAPGQATERP